MKMCYLDLDCVGSSLRREAQTPLATSSSSSGGLGGGDAPGLPTIRTCLEHLT